MTQQMEIIANPARYFVAPQHLYETSQLTVSEKIRALQNWIDEEKQLSEATSENMPGTEDADDAINKTLYELNQLLARLIGA